LLKSFPDTIVDLTIVSKCSMISNSSIRAASNTLSNFLFSFNLNVVIYAV